jgi:hypothetical protein
MSNRATDKGVKPDSPTPDAAPEDVPPIDPYSLQPHDPIDSLLPIALTPPAAAPLTTLLTPPALKLTLEEQEIASFLAQAAPSGRSYAREDKIEGGIYPAQSINAKLTGPDGNKNLQIWYKLNDHKVTILQNYNASGPRMQELMEVFGFTAKGFTLKLLKDRACRVEIKRVLRPPPTYKLLHVLPPEQV